ncbi:MAG: addiction module protein [Magnetococcales bacterium]|nr:addiction module protein [Magnetococcales bacterium]
MPSLGQTLVSQAMQLPEKDRAELAARLLRSLDQGKDAYVEDAWKEEVRRRVLDLEEGRTTSSPWTEARERLEHVAKTDR